MQYFDAITLFLILVPMPAVLIWSAYDLWRDGKDDS